MRPIKVLLAFLLLLTGAGFVEPARAEKRVALVIGNAAYKQTAPLTNTRNDATDIAAALQRLGFEVSRGFDLDKRAMEQVIREFDQKLAGAEIALFFYAGHGVQIAGQNYLVPTDARLAVEGDVDFESLPVSLVLKRMERTVRTSIVLLDACRDNPLARNLARSMGTRSASVGQGLAEVRSGIGTLISFSTQPGNVALDGDGRNSPYSAALLKQIEVPNRDVLSALAAVRGEVVKATGGRQVPWEHTSLLGPVVLKATAAPPAGPAASEPGGRPPSAAAEAWPLVKDTTSVAALEAFILRFGDTFHGDLAKARLDELRSKAPPQTNILGRPVTPPRAPPPRDQAAVPGLRFDGSYQAANKDYWGHLRFYEDGTVISVSSTGQAAEIAGWFNKEKIGSGNISSGQFTRQGNRVTFSASSGFGSVDYEGTIEADGSLKLKLHSRINGHRSEEVYQFVPISGTVPTPPTRSKSG